MIPKIIHYCWFGGKPKPKDVLKYMDTWKAKMPDYELREWNEDNFDVDTVLFTKEAYYAKKFAFVSDFVRLYALNKIGGIYFDTDIEALKPFDDLLYQDYLLGYESPMIVGTGVMAATPGISFLQSFMETYLNKGFVTKDGHFDTTPNPNLLTSHLKENNYHLKIYGAEYFCAKDYLTGKIYRTPNTYCIHHYAGSWLTPWQQIKMRIHHLLGF